MEGIFPELPEGIWVEHIISKLGPDHHLQVLQPLSLVCKDFRRITNRCKKSLKIYDPTFRILPSLLTRFPNLTTLSLYPFSDHDCNPILLQFALSNPPLQTLDLSNNKNLPISSLLLLTRLPSSLKSLILASISYLTDADLKFIADNFPNLEELDISSPRISEATDHGLSLLASKLTKLRKINLEEHDLITDEGILSLSNNCVDLEEIVVKKCDSVTLVGLAFAMGACMKLSKIGLHKLEVNLDLVREPLNGSRKLSVIEFSYMDVSDELLDAVVKANLPLLKGVGLFHCKGFTYAGLLSLVKSYPVLDWLGIEGVYFLTDELMCTLAKSLTNARSVKLNNCGRLSDSTFFTLIKLCPLLECVEMEHTKMGKEDFVMGNAVRSKTIKTLNMSFNKNLTNESLKRIALACPELEMLELGFCPGISGSGVGEILRNCRKVKNLLINDCLGLKNLDLDSNTQKLELLVASNSGLNDEALIDIAKKCPDLVALNLSDCLGITSEGVKHVVTKCTKLREINLKNCQNMSSRDFLVWMVYNSLSLRKIGPPLDDLLTLEDVNLYLDQRGCYVSNKYKVYGNNK